MFERHMAKKHETHTQDFPVYVINLETSQTRREHITRQLKNLDLGYSLFKAVYGKALSKVQLEHDYDSSASILENKRDLSLGEIGCALSHLGVYQEIVGKNLPYALILEDDANLSPRLPHVLELLSNLIDPEENVVYMLNHVHRYTLWGNRRLGNEGRLCRVVDGYCANGYVVTRASAQALLSYLYPIHTVADGWTVIQKRNISRVLGLVPYVIGHYRPQAEQSTIEDGRSVAEQSVKKKKNWKDWVWKYLYYRFFYQLIVKPLFRLRKQKTTW